MSAGRYDDSSGEVLELAATRTATSPSSLMVAGALDEGRIGRFERQHAMLCQVHEILETEGQWPGHDLT